MRASLKNTVIPAVALVSILALPARSATGGTSLALPQRGMSYATWDRDRFASSYSDASVESMARIGVEYIAICVTWYQQRHDSTQITANDRSPSLRSVRHLIRKAHSEGMKVMLKPHVDLIDKIDGTYWRADIGFACDDDWDEWFRNYTDYILKYARLAERTGVKMFCVGTELSFTTQKPEKWRELISKVREVYSGKLTYAANWDNYQRVGFWDELDLVGIDAYFPLSYESEPSLEDLRKGWSRWADEIETWLERSGIEKKVLFTELGYASTPSAASSPWQGGAYGNADPYIQKKCYQAFFDTIWHRPWLGGVYWWKWNTNTRSGGVHNRRFTPQNKPAEDVLRKAYNPPRSTKTDLTMIEQAPLTGYDPLPYPSGLPAGSN